MKHLFIKKAPTISFLVVLTVLAISFSRCSSGNNGSMQAKVDSLEGQLKKYDNDNKMASLRLARFDTLDFDYYSHEKWDSLAVSHDANIKVYYPDGSTTQGLKPAHVDALKPVFIFAPDTRITSHPVKFGTGDWTAVIGVMEGTFSKPMPIGGGKTIPPTGKKFNLMMTTIGHWKDGKMFEEYLFWDNQAFAKQIGLAK